MKIDLMTYFVGNLFWIYTVYRFNALLLRKSRNKCTVRLMYLLFYLVSCGVNLIFHHPLCNLVVSLAGLGAVAACYQAEWKNKILCVVLVYSVSMLCDIVVTTGFNGCQSGMYVRSAEIVLGYLLMFLVEVVIERSISIKEMHLMRTDHWIVLVLIPIGSILSVCMLILEKEERISRSVILSTLLFINIVVFYLSDEIQKIYIKEAQQEFDRWQMKMNADKMSLMVESQKRVNAIYHDLKYHMQTIGALAECSGNEEICAYLREMKVSLDRAGRQKYAENDILDNVLNYMLKGKKEKLKVLDVQVEFPKEVKKGMYDLSVIIGNLLDNSIRSAEESEEKRLIFHMKYERGILNILLENSMGEGVIKQNGRLLSTKSDRANHGIGLENVEKMIEKYHGVMNLEYGKNCFVTKVFLYIDIE